MSGVMKANFEAVHQEVSPDGKYKPRGPMMTIQPVATARLIENDTPQPVRSEVSLDVKWKPRGPMMTIQPVATAQLIENDDTPPPPAKPDYSHFIGKHITEIHVFSLPRPHRILRPGDKMTMDYRPERLNISLDGEDIIRFVRWG
eukprot:TRINITY_DN351_c0_g1_i1.p1 TRINITY_DN351_c0_g1~~TRINITY_DN351_c0_g1_i1.p1  ORF type:complete len:145 (-),score=12.24 TRINITY_DN351_c0_g1_i1:64-498(-)